MTDSKTLWFHRTPDSLVSPGVSDPEIAIIGHNTPDFVRIPEELGGGTARVLKAFEALCPQCEREDVTHYHLDADINVAQCPQDGFLWYQMEFRREDPATAAPDSQPAWTPFEPGLPIESDNPWVGTKETWVNSRYQVFVYRRTFEGMPFPVVHLSIKTQDREPIRDWRDLQRIKNELCGTESEAAELFPAEDRLSDMANQFHLWVLPPGAFFPFGFEDGRMVSGDEGHAERMGELMTEKQADDLAKATSNAKQRPFEPHHNADGCGPVGPVWAEWVAAQAEEE
jgi:hypothetical protein